MRVALWQTAGTPGEREANLEALDEAAGRAAGESARLLVAPELFLTGYNIGPLTRALAEAADGRSARAVADIARRHSIAIVYGYPERAGEQVFNAALVVSEQGETLANYRKIHLFGALDLDWFAHGDRLVVVDIAGLRVGVCICYDVEFPELARAYADAGVQLLAVPTAVLDVYAAVPERMVPVRAWENGIHIAYVNHCGAENGLKYAGASVLAGPDGGDLVRAGSDEALLLAEVEPAAITRARLENPYLHDRRPAAYALR